MGIVSTVELARTVEIPLGERAVAKRSWICTLSDDTLQNNPLTETDVFAAVGVSSWYDTHPTWTSLSIRKFQITERHSDSPYHVEVVAEYGPTTANEVLAPTSRDAEWTFATQPSQVPALYYYNGTGNSDRRPLVNSAYDYFDGLTTEESMVKATVRKNFAAFPISQMSATNSINDGLYFSCPIYTWKCAGVNATYTIELHNNASYTYWAAQIELMYRQTGWVLQLPDVGWNYLSGGQRRRAMVFDFQNGEWIASPNPVGLDGSGNQTNGQPAILQRRVNPATNFTTLFGVPPS